MPEEFPFSISPSDQIGLLRSKFRQHEVSDVGTIASGYRHLKQLQIEDGVWCYDIYTQNGSDSSGIVVNHANGRTDECIIWPLNHYLALNRNPLVIQAAKEALEHYGAGCGTSAMSGGHNHLHKRLEKMLAETFKKESSILFTTGYSANVGALSGLAKGSKNLILIDRDAHASLIDGCKLAGCKYLPFKHNSIADLEKKLDKYSSKFDNIFVVVESVYSMSGNHSPLEEIVGLRDKYGFLLFVDEAHGFGIYASNGGGRCVDLGISDKVDFVMTTLSKATGSIGGVVATSRDFTTMLQVEANAYLFQAALPPADTAAVIAAMEIISNDRSHVEGLWKKTKFFRKSLASLGFDVGSGESPIIPVYVRDSEKLLNMGKEMLDHGIFTTSVAYPVVNHKEVRFRFILNASHTEAQIKRTLEVLIQLGRKYNLIS